VSLSFHLQEEFFLAVEREARTRKFDASKANDRIVRQGRAFKVNPFPCCNAMTARIPLTLKTETTRPAGMNSLQL
jgi:hypothetical protein